MWNKPAKRWEVVLYSAIVSSAMCVILALSARSVVLSDIDNAVQEAVEEPADTLLQELRKIRQEMRGLRINQNQQVHLRPTADEVEAELVRQVLKKRGEID